MLTTLQSAYECAVAHTDDHTLLTDLRLGTEAAELHVLRGEKRQLAEVVDAFEARLAELCRPALWGSPLWDHLFAVRSALRELEPASRQGVLL